MKTPTDTLVAALTRGGYDPRSTGRDSWESRCPAHDGSRRNLSITTDDDGKVLVHCHHADEAGRSCAPEAIVSALGLTMTDLYPADPSRNGHARTKGKSKTKGRCYTTPKQAAGAVARALGCDSAKAWSYPDVGGEVGYLVYRFDPPAGKTYRPMHKSPEGWRIGDPPGPLPLYRLPDLAAATRIYVCEGEKAADAVRDLGVTATTSAHGAKSPHKSDWEPLAGKDVVILPDADNAGEGYTVAVVGLLGGLSPRPAVRIVRMGDLWRTAEPIPEGGDAADWVADGVPESWEPDQCRAELDRVADAAPVVDLDAAPGPGPDVGGGDRPASDPPNATQWESVPPDTCLQCHDRDPFNHGYVVTDEPARCRIVWRPGEPGEASGWVHKSLLRYMDGRSLQADDPGALGPQEWPPLRLAELPEAVPFPADVFPPSLADYCREAATAMLAPVDLVGVAMLAVAGSAIGQSANITLKRGWTEAPLLYVVPVARPGRMKSPVIRTVTRPLAEIDKRLRKESHKARQQWEEAKRAHAKDSEANPPPGPEPPQLRAIVKDITRESLSIILKDNPRGVLCGPDEATAWVGSFNEYKSKGGSDRQYWLSIWSSDPVSVDRKGGRESIYVPYPYISVIGGLPPAMLGSLADDRGRDDGFLDRILFTYPADDAYPVQRWTEVELSEAAEQDWANAIARLHSTPMVLDPEAETERPFHVGFTDAGKREWVSWFNAHCGEMEDPGFNDGQAGAWSKLRAYAARLAMILSGLQWACNPTARPNPGPIDVGEIRGAVRLTTYFKAHLMRVRHEMTGGIDSASTRSILAWVRRTGREAFSVKELTDDLRWLARLPGEPEAALTWLESRHAIRRQADPARPEGARGRKPSPRYEIHPDLRTLNTQNTRNSADSEPNSEPDPEKSVIGVFSVPGETNSEAENVPPTPNDGEVECEWTF